MKKKIITLLDAVVFLFVLLFIYAALSKSLKFGQFYAQISKSPLITNQARAISFSVPIFEIFVSFLLLFPKMLLLGLYASFFLMFTFTAYIAFIVTISPYVPCSCGGILDTLGWTEHLILNVGFVMLSVVGIVLYNKQKTRVEIVTP